MEGGGAHPARTPPKIGKNKIFWRKIVIFNTKYPKNVRASLRSAQFFLVRPLTWNPGSAPALYMYTYITEYSYFMLTEYGEQYHSWKKMKLMVDYQNICAWLNWV
jgi:hypothetical protein